MTKRGYGTGQLYLKHGAYYGRWRTLDGRRLNRRIGAAGSGGLTRTEAERQFRKLQEAEERRPLRSSVGRHTLDDVIASLRRRLAVEGARKSYLQNCESMQRVHISPRLGSKPVDRVTVSDVETVAAAMLDAGLSPKTVRNVVTFLHSAFEHAIDRGAGAARIPSGVPAVPSAAAPATPTRTSSSSRWLSSRPCCARSPTLSSSANRRQRAAAAPATPRRSRPISSGPSSASSC